MDPDGRSYGDAFWKLLKGLGKCFIGGLGTIIFGTVSIGLVVDDAAGVGVVDDGLLTITTTGTLISGGYFVEGFIETEDALYDVLIEVETTIDSIIYHIKAKDRKKKEKEKSQIEKHGTSDWEEPASEEYGKWKARELEKQKGKDARRESHDLKDKGEQDRSKRQLGEDYE